MGHTNGANQIRDMVSYQIRNYRIRLIPNPINVSILGLTINSGLIRNPYKSGINNQISELNPIQKSNRETQNLRNRRESVDCFWSTETLPTN